MMALLKPNEMKCLLKIGHFLIRERAFNKRWKEAYR
jgi:hypothetical protein